MMRGITGGSTVSNLTLSVRSAFDTTAAIFGRSVG
jgi:hypothetical protein